MSRDGRDVRLSQCASKIWQTMCSIGMKREDMRPSFIRESYDSIRRAESHVLIITTEFTSEDDLHAKLELGKVYPFVITFFGPKERRMTLKPAN